MAAVTAQVSGLDLEEEIAGVSRATACRRPEQALKALLEILEGEDDDG